MAIAADTIIHTMRGPKTVSYLAAKGETFYGFQWTGVKITVARICVEPEPRNVWTRRVVLDSGTSLRTTSDQVFLTRRGDHVDARYLSAGASLMPLYLGVRKRGGYPTYRQMGEVHKTARPPSDRKRSRSVARMVYQWASGAPIPPGMYVRHKDGDPTNCMPDNLRLEGHERKRNEGKLDRLRRAARIKLPNNHKVVGQEVWKREDCFDVVPVDCDTFAAGEVFLMGTFDGA